MPTNPEDDCFGPPAENTEVGCIECGEVYDSFRIEWRVRADGQGFWHCPTPGCGGAGFGFDIFPTDPDWVDPEGNLQMCWTEDLEEDEMDTDLDHPDPPLAPRPLDPHDDIPF